MESAPAEVTRVGGPGGRWSDQRHHNGPLWITVFGWRAELPRAAFRFV